MEIFIWLLCTSIFQRELRSGFAICKQNLLTLEWPHFGCVSVLRSSHKENVGAWGGGGGGGYEKLFA